MHIPGHIAIALIYQELLLPPEHAQETTVPLLIASLFPDIIDKSIGYILHAMPNGRHFTHNVFSVILLSGVVGLIWGKRAGYAWFVGHLSHILADKKSMIPWFFPLKKYSFQQGRLRLKPGQLIREGIFLGLVLWLRYKN